ncbi:DUF2490 domain-containing protein [uncultured Zobellia sp.]|uniref:DUF2490 domain-containing protein n=1 Tax=uncultured Zobellia sp. TaxID=255433 RepID=UPI002599790A|nr:DUF2490 domain-containing protein [uncultured Zobellia sp.]
MITSYTKNCIVVFCCVIVKSLVAQHNLVSYWEPEVSLSVDIAPLYSQKFSFEKRSLIYDEGAVLTVQQFDLAHFSEYQIMDNQSLAIGLMYRSKAPLGSDKDEFRITEQYSTTHTYVNYRLGHRFRLEQRFSGRPVEHRMRYRIAIDFPLQGTRLDVGELFFSGSLENILSLGNLTEPEYSQRYAISFGKLMDKDLILIGGLEYRFENYTRSAFHEIFLVSSLKIKL